MVKFKPFIEIAIVLVISFTFWEVLSKNKFFEQHPAGLQTLILIIWTLIPTVVIASWGRSFKDYGITIHGWVKSLKEAIVLALLVLPLFILARYFFQASKYPEIFTPEVPHHLLLKSVYLFLFISLPEEYFFRGYLQTEFNKIFDRKYCLFHVKFGMGLFITAFLFVAVHIWIGKNWYGLMGLGPALLFGWLKEKTKSIIAPVFFHGFCDITYIAFR